jgi:AhpC/TSA family
MITTVLALSVMTAPAAPEVGAAAPTFSLPAMTGKSVSLADHKGKWVVLEWTNNGCPFVVKHYKDGHMQATQKWAKDKGVVWMSIVSSAPGKQGYVDASGAKSFYTGDNWKGSQLLLDPEGKVGRLFDAKTTPHMFVISPDQKVVYMGAIDSVKSANTADIEGATNYVRTALTEAMAGKAVTTSTTRPYGCSVKY